MADYTELPTDELIAQLAPRGGPARSTVADQSAASPAARIAPTAAAPDLTRASNDELLSALPGRAAATPVQAAPATAVAAPSPAPSPSAGSPAAVAPKPDQRGVVGEIGHQLGLTARAAVNGVVAPFAMVSDAVTGPVNAGLDAALGQGNGFRFQKAARAVNSAMDAIGVAKPENATERVVQDIASGAATAATGVGLAGIAQKAAGPVASAVGQALSAAPGMQVASGAASGAASGLTREGGGGEGAQAVAGLAGALAPSVLPFAKTAAINGAVRGGEAGRQRMAENIQTFQDAAGTTPTLGQATGARGLQAAETGLANAVGSSGVMIRKGQEQSAAMADSVQKLADSLAPNANGMGAGEAIQRGVQEFKNGFKKQQEFLYGVLDKHIAPDQPIAVNTTQQALKDLTADIPGAPNLSAFFKNAKISAIERALVADLDAAAKAQAPTGMSAAGAAILPGQLPYEAIKKLRTMVGREMADSSIVSDVPRSKWTALYGALSDDLRAGAKAAGVSAQRAWNRANAYTAAGMQRLEQLDSVVSRDAPEKVFKAALSGSSEGATTIRRVMRSLPADNRREVAAATLQRLGRANPGQQNELGDAFSSETFLTNLAKLSPEARQALFGSTGMPGLEKKLNQLGRLAAMRREGSQVFANPSGTARQGAMLGWAATLIGGIAAGNPTAIMGALAGPVFANGLARKMTSPTFVQDVAKPASISPGAQGALATGVERMSTTSPPQPEPAETTYYQNQLQARRALAQQGGGQVLHTDAGWMVLPDVQRFHDPDSEPEQEVQHYADGGLVRPFDEDPRPASTESEAEEPLHLTEVDLAAHEAASSPLNELREPTEAQAKAGNYKKGHLRFQGLDITIENPQGSTRRGKDPDGQPWESLLASHYGYIKNTRGADGDQLDVFIGPDEASRKVFVVDQINEDGSFDEHKALLGFDSAEEAKAAYLANYPAGWSGLGALTELPMAAFKAWVQSGNLKASLGELDANEEWSGTSSEPAADRPVHTGMETADA